ncbi:alpha/beta fold hydrolase [Streptomyces deccanensis]|uniref:alpha/beta fold hydrolase n=1 Tax=Streptomyces deccanensis TaxID=424188 RepID=UPI001EFB0142|nr:alpha/beta hydrolase [Streptomyces deccanensis]ULR48494.1 alpha/beta hydrolase [Streptomyces deccanensis]
MLDPPSATQVLSVSADDGTPLAVYRDGAAHPQSDGATLVLVHGASVTADLWRLHTRHLTGLGFTVLRYDQRAHGRTARGRAPLTVEQLADDLHHILGALAPTGPLVLAGHSLGALVLQELAARHPSLLSRIRGMVLLSSTAHGASVLPGRSPRAMLLATGRSLTSLTCAHAPWAVDRVRRLLPDTHPYALTPRPETGAGGGPPPCRDGVRHTLTADLAALWQALRRYRARRLPVLEQLDRRLLLMAGAEDRHIPAARTAQLADRLPGARLEILPRTTHTLPVRHHALISARIARLATGPHPDVRFPKDPSFPNVPLSEPFH